MMPSYVNIGAYVDEGTMVDTWATVGSCAQIGKRVHLSAAAQIGGVLEPAGAMPVIIEDDVIVGGNCGVYEGAIVREGAVLARKQRRLGALVLEDKPLARPDAEKLKAAMLDGVRQLGLSALPWNDDLARWRERVAFLRRLDESWPDLSDTALLPSLETWLAPFLDKVSRRDHLAHIDLAAALKALVPWDKQRTLDRLAPTHIDVPSGSRVPVDYANPAEPTLSVRLQEMFGLLDTPRVGGGKVPLTLHLLSPARRPVQVTRDLASFWASGYRAVKAELKGRYPRHYWPDDPLVAEPTARVRPRPR